MTPSALALPYENDSMVDRFQESLSTDIFYLTNSIDQFYLNEKELSKDNGTRLRIYNTYNISSSDAQPNELAFRFRLRLPRLSKKLKLVFERRDADLERRSQSAETLGAIEVQELSDDIQAGVDYGVRLIRSIQTSFRAGLRFRDTPYPFVKTRIYSDFKVTKKTEINTSLSVYWDERDEYTQTFYLDANRQLRENLVFRWTNQQQWTDIDQTLRTWHGPSFFQKLSDRRYISYFSRLFTRSRPNFQAENLRLGVSYRQMAYKNWFFYELTPFIDFPKEQNFISSPGVLLKLEATIGSPVRF